MLIETMNYSLFLFDADDTLFDFKAAERHAFGATMAVFTLSNWESIFETYRHESERVWRLLESNRITKEELKVERFRRTFEEHGIEVDPSRASDAYLEALSETDILNHYAFEICEILSGFGEVGIVTNGIVTVQKRRLQKSKICSFISFIAVSDECGYSKPDIRFFEYSVKLARNFSKKSTLVIGDRIETDIIGANNFGLASCLFNPSRTVYETDVRPKYEISCLSELKTIVKALTY